MNVELFRRIQVFSLFLVVSSPLGFLGMTPAASAYDMCPQIYWYDSNAQPALLAHAGNDHFDPGKKSIILIHGGVLCGGDSSLYDYPLNIICPFFHIDIDDVLDIGQTVTTAVAPTIRLKILHP